MSDRTSAIQKKLRKWADDWNAPDLWQVKLLHDAANGLDGWRDLFKTEARQAKKWFEEAMAAKGLLGGLYLTIRQAADAAAEVAKEQNPPKEFAAGVLEGMRRAEAIARAYVTSPVDATRTPTSSRP